MQNSIHPAGDALKLSSVGGVQFKMQLCSPLWYQCIIFFCNAVHDAKQSCWTVLMRGCLLVVIQMLVCLVTQLKVLCQWENQSSPLIAHNPAINSYTTDNY